MGCHVAVVQNWVLLWLPQYRKAVIEIEGVQKRFSRMLYGMECCSFKERLGLFTLEHQRFRGNKDIYKITTCIVGINSQSFCQRGGD